MHFWRNNQLQWQSSGKSLLMTSAPLFWTNMDVQFFFLLTSCQHFWVVCRVGTFAFWLEDSMGFELFLSAFVLFVRPVKDDEIMKVCHKYFSVMTALHIWTRVFKMSKTVKKGQNPIDETYKYALVLSVIYKR